MPVARAVRRTPDRPANLSAHRRSLAARGALQAWVHEGPNFDHCLELSTTGALGTLLLTRQNLAEMRRMLDAAEERFEALDERGGSPFQRPPERLVF